MIPRAVRSITAVPPRRLTTAISDIQQLCKSVIARQQTAIDQMKRPLTRLRHFQHLIRKIPQISTPGVEKPFERPRFRPSKAGAGLATGSGEDLVFRVGVVSIVLALAVGPNVSLLCRTWCDPQAAAASGCHHQYSATSPRVTADDRCPNVVLNAAFLKEDIRQVVPASDTQQAVVIPGYQFARLATGSGPDRETEHLRSSKERPLETVLRL